MAYKWKPNATQRRAFAERMKDPDEQAAYQERKRFKNSYEGFKYKSFVPTQEQVDFVLTNPQLRTHHIIDDAFNMVVSARMLNEPTAHEFIHIVNSLRRGENPLQEVT